MGLHRDAGSDASDETGITQTADNAPAEKSGAAKYSHTRRHDAKVWRRLRLSYSHSTADQSASHRDFAEGGKVSARVRNDSRLTIALLN